MNCRKRAIEKYEKGQKCGFSKKCKSIRIQIGTILGDSKIIEISKKKYNDGRERTILKRKCLVCYTETWTE